jgi:hypothetical protein
MGVAGTIYAMIAAAVVVMGVIGLKARLKLPVCFKSCDELNAVSDIARWADKQIGADDPRKRSVVFVRLYLSRAWFPIGIRLDEKELAVLAPFIDRCIAGEGPPTFLAAEYEDYRPAALRGFKARLQAEGLWPTSGASVVAGVAV